MSTIEELKKAALEYHRKPPAGKIKVTPTKPVVTQRELSLAYSPGVAAACEEIVRDPREAATLTTRGNLVAVITNGTAVLGLGNIGPLAGKPVMEGKGMLFQKFAGIDVFDIEIDEKDPTSSSTSSRASSRRSAASTSRTSRRRSASRSRGSSASA
jgi:malate dehydrogenase (oxaloacetate-decarboxylating)(NADP+)